MLLLILDNDSVCGRILSAHWMMASLVVSIAIVEYDWLVGSKILLPLPILRWNA